MERGRPKGLPKTGGREKGVENKVTKDLRHGINNFLSANWHKVQDDFDSLTDPKDRLTLIIKMLEFSVPKMRSVDMQAITMQKIDALTDEEINIVIDNILNNNNDNGK